MAIVYSLHMCARHVDSTNPGRSNLVFRSKPIAEAEMSNLLIGDGALNSGADVPQRPQRWLRAWRQTLVRVKHDA